MPAHRQLLAQAISTRKAGRPGQAIALCQQAQRLKPDDELVLNTLAVLLGEQGWILPAFEYASQAFLLTRGENEAVATNFRAFARSALNHLDADQAARHHAAYQAWRTLPRGISARQVSVLLASGVSADTLHTVLDPLLTLDPPPSEVLLAADMMDATLTRHQALNLRGIPLSGDDIGRINALADAAQGEYLLLPGRGATDGASLLTALAAQTGPACAWSLAYDPARLSRGHEMRVNNALSAGYPLLSVPALGAPGTPLLVSRALHQQVGGLPRSGALPWLDYCLRLLWLAEPALVRVPALADLPPAPTAASRAAVLDAYMAQALTDAAAPNPFAPCRRHWGLYLHADLIEEAVPLPAARMRDMLTQLRARLQQGHASPPTPVPGVNLVGAACGEHGLGENMRAITRAALDGGIPCAVRNYGLGTATSQGDQSLIEHFAERAPHSCSVFFLNPDQVNLYGGSLDAAVFNRPQLEFAHRKIGYWFWELEKLPDQWAYALSRVDEIWVATEFVAAAVRRATDKPVIKIPPPITVSMTGHYQRRDFSLPEDCFLFLFSFDFNGFAARKNPLAVVRAFLKAFPPARRDVALVIKTVNGANRPQDMAALLQTIGNDPRILLRDGRMTRDQVYGLQSVVDCFVSLHRSEGLGLGLAECMYQGKPVIATGYSGNLEFMNADNALLVDYRLVPVQPGEYLYNDPDYFWAQPDEDHAASQMQRMADDAGLRQRIAHQGQQYILEHFSKASTAARMRARLAELGQL